MGAVCCEKILFREKVLFAPQPQCENPTLPPMWNNVLDTALPGQKATGRTPSVLWMRRLFQLSSRNWGAGGQACMRFMGHMRNSRDKITRLPSAHLSRNKQSKRHTYLQVVVRESVPLESVHTASASLLGCGKFVGDGGATDTILGTHTNTRSPRGSLKKITLQSPLPLQPRPRHAQASGRYSRWLLPPDSLGVNPWPCRGQSNAVCCLSIEGQRMCVLRRS